jgi:hypothetical protein
MTSGFGERAGQEWIDFIDSKEQGNPIGQTEV